MRTLYTFFVKKFLKHLIHVMIIFAFFFSNIPYGVIMLGVETFQERNVIDLLYLAHKDGLLDDYFQLPEARAAEVTAEFDMTDATDEFGPSPTVVFTSEQVGYMFFVDAGNDLVYRKTVNGGTNWAIPSVIDNTLTGWTNVSVWYDQWTPGDTSGTKIHIAAADDVTDDVYYTFLDTNADTLKGSVVQVIPQTTFTETVHAAPSITKGGGGDLFITANFDSPTGGGFIYKSSDGAGNTWTNITPGVDNFDWSPASAQQTQILPLIEGNDIIAIKNRAVGEFIEYRIYDEVSDTWDSSWTVIATLFDNATFDQWFSATLDKSSGDIYLAFANRTNNVANDIEFWSFSDTSRTWTQGANVRTDAQTAISPVPVFNESTGDIYVTYLEAQTNFSAMPVGLNNATYLYYHVSSDGGASWSSQRGILSRQAGDDFKYIRGNLASSERLFVMYYNDDTDDIHGTTLWSRGSFVEADVDSVIVDATDEYGPSPAGVFVDEDIGYQFFTRQNIALDTTDEFGPSPTIVFTDTDVGYVFLIDSSSQDLVYRKTIDAGITWSGSHVIDTDVSGWTNVSVWYDQWTPGDTTGTKIHIAAADDAGDDVYYTFLDTSTDTMKGSMVLVIDQTNFVEAQNAAPSIAKGAGGDLFITANFFSVAGGYVYKSSDGAGNTWTDITPSGWSNVSLDQVQLVPLDTGNDMLAIRADVIANQILSQVYDESSNTWAGSWTTIAPLVDNATYDQWFSATLNKGSGDIYLTFVNNTNNAANDIEFWTFSDTSRSWTKGTDVVTNNATVLTPVPVYRPSTNTLYVAYARGTLNSNMSIYFKSSSNGGATWSAESTALNTVIDDYKFIRGSMMSDGNIFVAWYNDDINYIYGNDIINPTVSERNIASFQSLMYRKTTNGGYTWTTPYTVAVSTGITSVAVWYDQWTPGDTTGTKIHISFSEDFYDDYFYTYLDTATDRPGAPRAVLLGSIINETAVGTPGITKGAGGDLFLTGQFNTPGGGQIAKSTDGGQTWNVDTPSGWSTGALDQVQLLPLETDNDIIALLANTNSNLMQSRVYDEAANTWAGSWTTVGSLIDNGTYDQWFSATLDKSSGDVYLTFANRTANAANDIEFWSFADGSRAWTQGAHVVTDSATSMMPVPFFDQNNGDIYVAYGEGVLNTAVNIYFQKSMDGGATWSGQSQPLSPGIVDDVKAVRGNLMGGRMYVVWYNDDLNDIYGNTVADQWSLSQASFRFFANNDSTDVGASLAVQNTDTTLTSGGESFRLRMLLRSQGIVPVQGSNFKLQFAVKSGTCDVAFSGESYTDVTASSVIAYANNTTPADGDALTPNIHDPTDGATVVNQTYEELNNFSNTQASIGDRQDGKWDFALRDNGAPIDTSYCFRVVESDGTLLRSYVHIPEIMTGSSSGTGTISFSISDNSVGFGALSSTASRYATGDTTGSGTEIEAHTITASSNASNGYIISVHGTTLTSASNDTIAPIGASNTAPSVGTQQFGLRMEASGGDGTVTSPYAGSGFAFDTASFPDQVAEDLNGDDVPTTYSVRYLANIGADTAAGEYDAVLTYVITAGF